MAEAPESETAEATAGVLNEEQAFRLIAYLTSSAEISLHEPTYYGSLRLIDAASRLIGFMLEHDLPTAEPYLRELKDELDTKKVWSMWDREAYYDFVREAPAGIAAEMMRRESDAQS